jgi:hypothetical protein
MLEQNLRVVLLAAAQRAADGIEPEQFRRLNCLRREVLVFQGASPFRDGLGE